MVSVSLKLPAPAEGRSNPPGESQWTCWRVPIRIVGEDYSHSNRVGGIVMEKLTSPDKKSSTSQRHLGSAVPIVAVASREPTRVDALVMSKLPNIIAPVLALLLAGCAGSPPDSFRRTSSSDGSWNVGATHPRYDTLSPCDKDASIERAVISNDLPASQLGIRLLPGSTEKDAVRIAECLARTLTSGEIWISSPS